MSLFAYLAAKRPLLKKQLRTAKIDKTPKQAIQEAIQLALTMGIGTTFLLYLTYDLVTETIFHLFATLVISLYFFYNYYFLGIKAKISKHAKEIDKDVLFAGRYLIVKLNSGKPLINSLIDAANSYGTAEKYFKEIVKDIEMGKPLEVALSEAAEFSPSLKFKKILFQISNALKIGIDVTQFLEATLSEIAEQQIIEIQRYGKKLNGITLFYMLIGIVLPSLGMTMFVIVAGLSNLDIGLVFYGVALLFIIALQSMFLIIYRQARPNINI